MGRHADAVRSRGLAGWVVAAGAAIVVVILLAVGWIVLMNRADSAGPGLCSQHVTVTVAAGPGAAAAVSDAARAYNDTDAVVRSTCVTATVTTVPDGVALKGLADQWPTKFGATPGLWIPDNAAALAALDELRPDAAAGHPSDPFAWSPVVLAVRATDAAALRSLSWQQLPDAAGPKGSAALPGDQHLLLSLPPLGTNRATSYALQSMLATPAQSTALTAGNVTAHRDLLDAVGAGSVGSASTTAEALGNVASGDGPATAVPVVEADLAAFATGKDSGSDSGSNSESGTDGGGDGKLTAVYLDGQTVGDSLIAAPITDPSWVDRTLAAAAGSFQSYLGTPDGQQVMADHGWRTESSVTAHHAPPAVSLSSDVSALPAGGPDVDTALAAALGQPAPITPAPSTTASSTTPPSSEPGDTASTTTATSPQTPPTTPTTTTPTTPTTTPTTPTTTSQDPAASGPVLTLLVDASEGMSRESGGKTLLEWTTEELSPLAKGTITDRLGLWAFSDSGFLPPNGYPELVSTGKLGGKVDDTTRAKAIPAELDKLRPQGDRWAYGALVEALTKVPKAAVDGRQSRVLLITSGVDDTPTLPRSTVLDAVEKAKDTVRVDVIGLSDSVPVEAYTQIAKAGGGEYIPVTDASKLGQTITDLLTLQD